MKKVSAFSVFRGKKEGDGTPQVDLNNSKSSRKSAVKKASSTPAINEIDKKSKNILKAFRGGSFRGTIKGGKHRPRQLPSGNGESPFIAGDMGSVKLTGVKKKKTKETATEAGTKITKGMPTPAVEQVNTVQNVNQMQPVSPMQLCRICSEPTTKAKTHYGVYTCDGCANFYHRSMKLDKEYVCKNTKNCTVTYESRNHCKYCRLQECFRVGMPKKSDLEVSNETKSGSDVHYRLTPSPSPSFCEVCGDASKRSHWGKNICEACSDFFNRTMRKGKELKCHINKNCPVTKESRHMCSYCRLSKCLAVGMKRRDSPSPVTAGLSARTEDDAVAPFHDSVEEGEESPFDTPHVKRGGKRQKIYTEEPKSKKRRVEQVKEEEMSEVVPPPFSPRGTIQAYMYDSGLEAEKLFECMIHPVQTDKFFSELWQKKPLLVRRHLANYNDGWFSTQELDRILRKERLEFGVNLDVTTYKEGKRETHNPVGRAYAPVVWDFYQTGCSIRVLNPQTYSQDVWKMLSVLQEYFSCCVGANVYLTPPGTQGFAPHYDDIEAFILQLEGRKHWKLYNPRSESEVLPRTSSPNFTQDDIGEPILDVTLQAGDLLYMPRGIIHQGNTSEDAHSLHITFSCYQKNTWGDLLEKLVPAALEFAIEEDVEFRQGLPRDYLNYMGIAHSDETRPERGEFLKKITGLMFKMVEQYCPVDSACDQMGKKFLHDALPPVLTDVEKSCSIHGHGESWDTKTNAVLGTTEIEPDTEVKIIRKGVLRLVSEEDAVRIYHSLENERLYHAKDSQFIEISAEAAPAVEFLIHSYPEYVAVDSLPYGSVNDKVEIASILYDKGLLITKEPLDLNLDDSDDPEDDGH